MENPQPQNQNPAAQSEIVAEEQAYLGPRKISFVTFLLKVLAGGGGGVIGSLALFVIFLVSQSALTPLTEGFDPERPVGVIFIFILIVMVFIASTIGNILSTWLLSMTEGDKYTRVTSAIAQVSILSVIIFLLMLPVYFLTASIDISLTTYAVALHIIISAQVSALILEIVSNYRYALVGVYGVTFSILVSAGIMFAIAALVPGISPAILLFAALPIVWGSIALVQSIVISIYGWIARTYDKDFLSTQTLYGNDYGKQVEAEQEIIIDKKANDDSGADFLRNQK